ncbi:MAG: PAS domain S-box protein [Methanomicrobiales archaeon]|nr:PAS domain S-box protein [Methanomicrobiales archaeon]
MIHLFLLERETSSTISLLAYLRNHESFIIDTAASCSEAEDILRHEKYDAILSHHPEGMALLTSIRAMGMRVPFILFDDCYDVSRETTALHHGADFYLWNYPAQLPLLDTVIQNLSIRRQNEEQLTLDNTIMRAVLEVSPLAMAVVKDHVIIWMNELMPRMLGYEKHELLGTDPLLLIPGEEEHRRIDEGLFWNLDAQGWGSVETDLQRKDGSYLSCHLRSRPIDPNDPSEGNIIIGQDITDYLHTKELLRKSEIRYQTLLDRANSIVLRVSPDGTIRFINAFGQEFFGYSADELIGKKMVGTILSARSRTGRDLAAMIEEVMRTPEDYEINVNENMKKNGERVWVTWLNKAIRDDQGNLLEIVSVGNDITDRTVDIRNVQVHNAPWQTGILENTDLVPDVFEAAYSISMELSREGREGKPVGTIFLLGDAKNVLGKSKQLILNPFEGHPASARCIRNPDLKETIKELSQLDGAFVVSGDGVVEAAGRYITVDTSNATVPKGLGTRHASVAGITQATNAIGIVVSQSGGRISVFKDGRIVRIITVNE